MALYGAPRRHRQPLTKLQEIEEDYKVEQRALKTKFIEDYRKKQSQCRGDVIRLQRTHQREREHQAADHARRRRSLNNDCESDIYDLTLQYRGFRLQNEKHAMKAMHNEQWELQRRKHRNEKLTLEDDHQVEIDLMIQRHRQELNRLWDREQQRDVMSQQRYFSDRRAAVSMGW